MGAAADAVVHADCMPLMPAAWCLYIIHSRVTPLYVPPSFLTKSQPSAPRSIVVSPSTERADFFDALDPDSLVQATSNKRFIAFSLQLTRGWKVEGGRMEGKERSERKRIHLIGDSWRLTLSLSLSLKKKKGERQGKE